MCILIVEDNPVSRKFVESCLHRYGLETLPADSGAQALQLLQTHCNEIDLILLDIMLPDMDGIELFKQKNNNPAWRDIPVIMCTSINTVEIVSEAAELGCHDYLVKPITVGMLMGKIRSVFAKSERALNKSLEIKADKAGEDNLYSEAAIAFSKMVNEKIHLLENRLTGNHLAGLSSQFYDLKEASLCFGMRWVKDMLERLAEIDKTISESSIFDDQLIFDILKELKKLKSILPDESLKKQLSPKEIHALRHTLLSEHPDLLCHFDNLLKDNATNLIKHIKVSDLTQGMLTVDDIWAANGQVLLAKGQLITNQQILQLLRFSHNAGVIEPFRIIQMANEHHATHDAGESDLHSAPQHESPMDYSAVLEIVDGDMELLMAMISEFKKIVPSQLEEMRAAINDKNTNNLERVAHSLKGASSNFGVKKLTVLAEKLEISGKTGDIEKAPNLLFQLEKELHRFLYSVSTSYNA